MSNLSSAFVSCELLSDQLTTLRSQLNLALNDEAIAKSEITRLTAEVARLTTELATAQARITTLTPPSTQVSIFTTQVPAQAKTDGVPYELGTRFTVSAPTLARSIRFHKAAGETGSHVGRLWNATTRALIASVPFASETASGWQTQALPSSVQLSPGVTYVVSVNINRTYSTTGNLFGTLLSSGVLSTGVGAGVYSTRAAAIPEQSFSNSSYFVDIAVDATSAPPPPGNNPTPPPPSNNPTPLPPSNNPTPLPPVNPSTSLKGWELNRRNTGLAAHGLVGSQLPAYSGPIVIPAGSVISGVRFTGNIDLSRGNIVIEKCCFRPVPSEYGQGLPLATTTDFQREPYPPAPSKVIIRDCEFDGSLLSAERAAFAVGFWGIADLQRNHFHHLGGGFALYNTGTQLDSLVEHNYVSDMIAWGNPATTGNHIDAFSIRDFTAAQRPARTAIIRNNHFDPTTQENVTGAFFIQPLWGRIDNVTIEGNLLVGAGWCLGLEQKTGYSNIRALNNRFAPTGFGSTYYEGPGWTTWQANHRYDPSKPDAKGVTVNP
jgi:hypothetical protein